MTDLKPCPFCGGEASFKPRSFKTSCDLCGAYVPTGATSSDESIAAWNHRAPSTALIKAEEALKGIAANSCCDGCREAALVAFAALTEIKKLRGE